jgi:hypothetical protein
VVVEISAGGFLVGDAEDVGADEDGRDKDAVALEGVLECGQDLCGVSEDVWTPLERDVPRPSCDETQQIELFEEPTSPERVLRQLSRSEVDSDSTIHLSAVLSCYCCCCCCCCVG